MSTSEIEEILPLTPMQQGMLFHSMLTPEESVYFEQSTWILTGLLNPHAFEIAWRKVIDRHMALRAAFILSGLDEPVQVIYRHLDIPFNQFDWSKSSPVEQQTSLEKLLLVDRDESFDPAVPPLMRFYLIKNTSEQWTFVWSHHHVLLDGWSQPILLNEFIHFYEASQKGEEVTLPSPCSYRSYIAWLQQQNRQAASIAWKAELSGFQSPTSIHLESPFPANQAVEENHGTQKFLLSQTLSDGLTKFCRQHQLTLNTLFQGVWGLLLSRYTRQEDIVFGSTVSGRPTDLPGSEGIVGLLINTLPARIQIDPDMATLDWLKTLQARQANLRQYDYCSLTDIQGWSEIPRDLPLFETLLVYENYPVDPHGMNRIGQLQIQSTSSYARTNYPLTLAISPGECIGLSVHYTTNRFDDLEITRLLGHIQTILESILLFPEKPIVQQSMLTEVEKHQIFEEWNHTKAPYPEDQCAHQLFEGLVHHAPDNIALVYQDKVILYDELDRQANQLAHYLINLGISPGQFIGICLERGPAMIVSLLAVMKIGCAYIPMDPRYPPERLAFMLDDSGANTLITQTSLLPNLTVNTPHLVCLDAEQDNLKQQPDQSPKILQAVNSPAYIIYTSGSTGKPKGVLAHHRGLVNFITAFINDFHLNEDSRILQFSSFSFDASVNEIFAALLSGGRLILADSETLLSIPDLIQLCHDTKANTAVFSPSLLDILDPADLPDLLTIISAGDTCPPKVAQRWTPGRHFANGYGPTETSIGVCFSHNVIQQSPYLENIPIGKPIANMKIYLLDPYLQPVPANVAGELVIGGPGVTLGYLNRPELTAEKFIIDPFNPTPGELFYRTGDLGAYLPDGQILFLGRIDNQVKIRGFRIELGEIETALCQHPGIRQAVATAYENRPGEKKLVGYVVPLDAEHAPTPNELHTFLKKRMPAYMIPTVFIPLNMLPLLPSGKIDRQALPAPEIRTEDNDHFQSPDSPLAQGLAEIWEQVLNIQRVGMHDSFFDLGGHSLLATQLASRIREVFQVEYPLKDILAFQTLSEQTTHLMALLHNKAAIPYPPIEPQPHQNSPLSFAQQRLWFIDQLVPGSLFYNLPLVIRLQGQFNAKAFQHSLNELVRRHEILRTRFVTKASQPVQDILPSLLVNIHKVNLTKIAPGEQDQLINQLIDEEISKPFDLEAGPLFRVSLFRKKPKDNVIVLTMHHIITDGWSMGVFMREFAALYSAFSQGEESPLAESPVQYADFALWQRKLLQGQFLEEQLAYWKKQLHGMPPTLALPTNHSRPAIQSSKGETIVFELSDDLSNKIREIGKEEGATLYMTLLAGFQILLARYSGQEDIPVGTVIANRNIQEIEGLIGFFANTLVMRTDLSGNPGFAEVLHRVREVSLGAYAHQDLPFETLVEAIQPQRDLSHTPLFQVMMVLDPPVPETGNLPGLSLTTLPSNTGTASFDLTLSISSTPNQLNGSIEYNTDLWNHETIERLIEHFKNLLQYALADTDQSIWTLPYLTEEEKHKLLVEWNDTVSPAPLDQCAHRLFENQVSRQPDAEAVHFYRSKSLTYSELNTHANQLAHYLIKQGVGRETLVGISTERSIDSIIAILGTMKAGGGYLPLDPSYPKERLAFMMVDSKVPVLLTHTDLLPQLPAYSGLAICLDTEREKIANEPTTNPTKGNPPLVSETSDQLAYVIYTSGSTGKPKGALLSHRGLSNLAEAQRKAFDIQQNSRVLQFSPFSFDASVWETFMALANGGTLVLAPQDILSSGPDLLRLLQDTHISHATLPPSVLQVLPYAGLPDLHVVIAAGEACPMDLVTRWAPGRKFFNAYGPTETTVCASMYLCNENEPEPPPIGKPIPNTYLYVVDSHMQLLPIGFPGELLVGGPSLARGYLNRPELTSAKFILDEYTKHPFAKVYRTGDLVRYRTDGNIEFLGRIDHQVKVRGFRIELGEIETVLLSHPNIQQASVIARGNSGSDQRLIAYLSANNSPVPTTAELRSHLRQVLPEYMVPSIFVFLDTLPLTPSGKIDRQALPAPDVYRSDQDHEYMPPRTPVEKRLSEICAELLELNQVGVLDNFFDLGGHSLLATQFISRIREEYKVEIPLRALFEHPCIADLALEVEHTCAAGEQKPTVTIPKVSRDQHRLRTTQPVTSDKKEPRA